MHNRAEADKNENERRVARISTFSFYVHDTPRSAPQGEFYIQIDVVSFLINDK